MPKLQADASDANGYPTPGEATSVELQANKKTGGLMSHDHGPGWKKVQKDSTSEDINAAALLVVDAPGAGYSLVIDDLNITLDTDSEVTVREASGGATIMKGFVAARSIWPGVCRNGIEVLTENKGVEIITAAASKARVWSSAHKVPV